MNQIQESLLTESENSENANSLNLKTPRTAIFFAISFQLSKQLTGLNSIAVYGKETLKNIFPAISDVLPIIVCILPALS